MLDLMSTVVPPCAVPCVCFVSFTVYFWDIEINLCCKVCFRNQHNVYLDNDDLLFFYLRIYTAFYRVAKKINENVLSFVLFIYVCVWN